MKQIDSNVSPSLQLDFAEMNENLKEMLYENRVILNNTILLLLNK